MRFDSKFHLLLTALPIFFFELCHFSSVPSLGSPSTTGLMLRVSREIERFPGFEKFDRVVIFPSLIEQAGNWFAPPQGSKRAKDFDNAKRYLEPKNTPNITDDNL